jgi:hypothetical protein
MGSCLCIPAPLRPDNDFLVEVNIIEALFFCEAGDTLDVLPPCVVDHAPLLSQ